MRNANKRQIKESAELLDLKKRLRELESLKLLNPDDLEILTRKRVLRDKISELEKETSRRDVTGHSLRRAAV